MRILLPLLEQIPGFSPHQLGFYREFHRGVLEALQEMGHEAIPFPFASQETRAPGEAQSLVRILSGGGMAGVLDLCCWGYGLSHFMLQRGDGQRQPIYDMYDVPYLGLLLDHPYNQAVNGILAQRLFAACPDKGHPALLKLSYPELSLTGTLFSPPAVRPRDDLAAASSASRDIDVLYVGTLPRHALERFWRNRANGYWRSEYDSELCDAIVDQVLAAPERSFHLAVQEVLGSAAKEGKLPEIKSQLRAVEWHLRARFRHDAVSALARSGARMCIVGTGWEGADLPANAGHLIGIDYDDMFRLAGRAKVCLDSSTYLDGANDRVFSYALMGAVCFTNAAGYLRDQFGDSMHFYSMTRLDALADSVKELLAQPAKLRHAGACASTRVLASHTWRHRLEKLLPVLKS